MSTNTTSTLFNSQTLHYNPKTQILTLRNSPSSSVDEDGSEPPKTAGLSSKGWTEIFLDELDENEEDDGEMSFFSPTKREARVGGFAGLFFGGSGEKEEKKGKGKKEWAGNKRYFKPTTPVV